MPKCTICDKENLPFRTEAYLKEAGIEFAEIHGNEYFSHVASEGGEAIIKYDLKGENPYIKKFVDAQH